MIDRLQTVLTARDDIEFAVLVGSRATGRAASGSDWDIAVQWKQDAGLGLMEELARTEALKLDLARALQSGAEQVDLVDVASAGLAMRAAIAEEGLLLCGGEDLPWYRFLTRTWQQLEDWYWEQHIA